MTIVRRTLLVLGAAGFIGRHVCRALATRGIHVLGLGHGNAAEFDPNHWGCARWSSASIDIESIEALAGDVALAGIVHCGGNGVVASAFADPFRDYQRAVLSTAAALDFVRQRKLESCRVVLASSAAVYGDQGDVDLQESAVRSPISPYGFNKVAAESLCDSYARFFGVRSSVVRLFSVYGEGLRKQLLWDAMRKFSGGESRFFGTGNELRDWLHVTDAADLLARAALQPQSTFEVFNGGHEHASTRHVLTLLSQAACTTHQPEFSGETHIGNPRRLTADASHARGQLQWSPRVSLREGIKGYGEWFLQQAQR